MNEAEFQDIAWRKNRGALFGLVCGIVLTFGWMAFVHWLGIKSVFLMLPLVGCLLGPISLADRWSAELTIPCPHCGAELLHSGNFVMKSRTCHNCSCRVLEGGRIRRPEVLKRANAIEALAAVRVWLWSWPALFVLVGIIHWTYPSVFHN